MSRVHGPGSRLGIMGGGQLGRMLALAARRLGYRVQVYAPGGHSPTGQVADVEVTAGYDDEEAVRRFASGVDVLTFEFENVPADTVRWAAEHCAVRPGARALATVQNRVREKTFLAAGGFPVAPWAVVTSSAELSAAAARLSYPAVLKTAESGYDGKGQRKLESPVDLAAADLPPFPGVLEAWVPFVMEISVVLARGADGSVALFPVCENIHRHHILDVTLAPARLDPAVARRAEELASAVAARLEFTGVLAVEMFVLADGSLLVNEIAPRPHNSGHFSLDACLTDQFEQQLRAVCGLPLGSPELLRPCAMANLLGDLCSRGEPDWAAVAAFGDVKIHLYGKETAVAGRKMGHLTVLGATADEALARVLAARSALLGGEA
ncbi:MAG: 5-(carboxyamino)imidazole ribonucleotide synthase [Chthoniobacterales bacterium]